MGRRKKSEDKPWRDKETLESLYHEKGLNATEVADELGCCGQTVINWVERHGLGKKDKSDVQRKEWSSYIVDGNGYCMWSDTLSDEQLSVHRLLAIAKYGVDIVAGNHVHHKNGVRWDNRPENIEAISPSEHSKIHVNDRLRGKGIEVQE